MTNTAYYDGLSLCACDRIDSGHLFLVNQLYSVNSEFIYLNLLVAAAIIQKFKLYYQPIWLILSTGAVQKTQQKKMWQEKKNWGYRLIKV